MPLRHSLVTRLLLTSIAIAVAAIAATAWLATRTATRAIVAEQSRSLTDDKGVYEMLVGYAATHPDWSGAAPLISARAAKLDRRITLTTDDLRIIAESSPGPSLRTARPSAVVDPLNLDIGLTGGTERIDSRAVGPYRLTDSDRAKLRDVAAAQVGCLRRAGAEGKVTDDPGGRPVVTTTAELSSAAYTCLAAGAIVTPAERKALDTLAASTARCAEWPPEALLRIGPDFSISLGRSHDVVYLPLERVRGLDSSTVARLKSCLEQSRRNQLRPYVAPPALLFLTGPSSGVDRTTFTLSRENTIRIVGTTGAVLLATILITVLVGRRLVRPLRALTEAADRQAPIASTGRDEIGHLARALDASAERRDRAEAQRRAMVSDVAHELRTPLTNIRSWLEAAQDDLAPTDAQLVTLLHEEATQLQHIIDDLGDLAAADAGTLRIHPAPTDVRDLVGQVVESHRGVAHAAEVTLAVKVHGTPIVWADAVRLRQVVGNLVSNAIRYTPAGGAVTVGAEGTTITVRDTGVGIPAEHLPRIFDRFWRADESRSRATGGSGLGLAITRKLVEAHGGTIEVDSTPGEGSLFTVRLPDR
ncbi:HAMP domain-containing histidine kinase [Actinoplanes sp. LDG1-01]|uniref:histidine kinase n=1 Tax=Paractinoplanes lichenicola TaxID=2802976 RepID=A0ABS1VMW4_9ACTN|nr:HAMP domain-containing histidine kinase [Actinoplanes lichenicola]